MKKSTGGALILILTLILSLRYSLYPILSPPPIKTHLAPTKPLTFMKLQGFDDLFTTNSTPNFTHPNPNPNPNLIWAHMRPLLSRPDGLPGTAEGVREAGIAWKALVADIKAKEEVGGERRGKVCPFAVGGNGSESVVEIPCGLSWDSAITVVGVPVGRNGSSKFGIELVGDGDGGGKEVIVVRVNVSVGGDEVVVSQNSWRVESGWGEWEWCPAIANNSNVRGNTSRTFEIWCEY